MLGLLGLLELYTRRQREREAQRHAWRVEVLTKRGEALKADDVAKLDERVRRLEHKGLR